MEVKTCKTCEKQFLNNGAKSYCRICSKKWHAEKERRQKEADDQKWQEENKRNQALFEKKISGYSLINMKDIVPHANTLYIIGNGFDLMHRVPSSYYSFRDSLGKRNSLRETLEIALTAEDIWADFENSLGSLNLDLMGRRHNIDMWLNDFGFYDDEDAGAAEFYMAVEAAANPIINLVNELQPAFRRWVNSLEIGTDDRPLSDLISSDGKVLDFNYTEFVETLYCVHDVCYIHGNRKKKGKLILGHRPGVESVFHERERKPQSYCQAVIDVAQDNVFDLIGQYDEELTKDSQEIINNHQAFFNGLADIDQIIVIGHSISRVDWDYFIEIKKRTENANWYFGIFGLNDLKNMEELIHTLGIKEYSIFRTDEIWTRANRVDSAKPRTPSKSKSRVFKCNDTVVTVNEVYDLLIDGKYELVLPNSVKKVVFIGDYILITIDDLDGSILLFKRLEKSWTFVDRLESFEHQSLINRRLNHVYYEGNAITFVFNNRVRKYDLNSGKMVVNQQLRDAKSKEYTGIDIMMRLVGR
ncbi:MAG: bacteriophage abortive infection AbiH family protein [Eubacterium sp.]|nr:bacteriophage abortive infection AbiH family protein [Eubacterium sp.]